MYDICEDQLLVDFLDPCELDEFSSDSEVPMDLRQIPSPDQIFDHYDYIENGDFRITEEETICPNLSDIQENFISYMKEEEMKMFDSTFVESFFSRYKCSIEDIIGKSRTELWLENSIYGLQFHAFLCLSLNVPLPIVPSRNRKSPSPKRGELSSFCDPVLETLMAECENSSQNNCTRKRLAPRDQISLLVFIMDILNHPYFQNCVRWQEKASLTFEIIKPRAVAYFWMIVKENEMCSFENFTRAIRFKRNSGVFKHIDHKKRRVYQFNQKAVREYKSKRLHNCLTNALIKILEEN